MKECANLRSCKNVYFILCDFVKLYKLSFAYTFCGNLNFKKILLVHNNGILRKFTLYDIL